MSYYDDPQPLPDDANSRYFMEKFRRLVLEFAPEAHLHHIDFVRRRPGYINRERDGEVEIRLVCRPTFDNQPHFDQSHLLQPTPIEKPEPVKPTGFLSWFKRNN